LKGLSILKRLLALFIVLALYRSKMIVYLEL
jgi:hypothetical protein